VFGVKAIGNQVLHHLNHGDNADFPNVATFFSEAFRVLRPGSVLIIINSSGHDQHREGFWWAALIPKAIDRMLERMPPIDLLKENFLKAGFQDYEVVVPLVEVLQGEQYLDSAGPLRAELGQTTFLIARKP
jgi:SAM-dependent methyltransferase